MVLNEGDIAAAVRRDSPWWRDEAWADLDSDLREAEAAGIDYRPQPLGDLRLGGLYLLYGPRRVGKTVSVKRTIEALLGTGVEPLRIARTSLDGWSANRIGALYDYVAKVLTSSVGTAPRYWFLDEITATTGPWWDIIKNLRDNTALRNDCVVLTGSSNADLNKAIKALAGRRGPVAQPDRVLLPMSFATFSRSLAFDLPSGVTIRPDELMTDKARDAWYALAPYTSDLTTAWQAFLEVGGYPKAVGDWRRGNQVQEVTWRALWDVVRGDALTSGMSDPELAAIMKGIATRLTSPLNVHGLAGEAGVGDSAVGSRLQALIGAFIAWRCPRGDAEGRPDYRKQSKLYFIDPQLAQLPDRIHASGRVDVTRLSEQQLGVSLLHWCEAKQPGSTRSEGWINHYKGDESEVDFIGIAPDSLARMTPVESKYISGPWRAAAQTISKTALKRGVLATRDVLDVGSDASVWAVPTSFLAYAITTDAAM